METKQINIVSLQMIKIDTLSYLKRRITSPHQIVKYLNRVFLIMHRWYIYFTLIIISWKIIYKKGSVTNSFIVYDDGKLIKNKTLTNIDL